MKFIYKLFALSLFLMFFIVLFISSLCADQYELDNKWLYTSSDAPIFLAIAVDVLGNTYIAEKGGYTVSKYDPEGNFIKEWGSFGPGDGQFWDISSIVITNTGDYSPETEKGDLIVVGDKSHNRAQSFTPNGSFGHKVMFSASVESMAVTYNLDDEYVTPPARDLFTAYGENIDRKNAYYTSIIQPKSVGGTIQNIATYNGYEVLIHIDNTIKVYNRRLRAITEFSIPHTTLSFMAQDKFGNLMYASSSDGGLIRKYDLNGTYLGDVMHIGSDYALSGVKSHDDSVLYLAVHEEEGPDSYKVYIEKYNHSAVLIRGEIKDQDGVAMSNMPVYLTGDLSTTTYTGADGVYRFDAPIGGTYQVIPDPIYSNFSPTNIEIDDTSSDQLGKDFTGIYKDYTIQGYVEDEQGSTINKTSITLIGISVTGPVSMSYITGPDGSYEFDVIYGTYAITAHHIEAVFDPASISTMSLVGDLANQNFIVQFTTYTINGYVEDSLGNKVRGSTITLAGTSSTGAVSLTYIPTSDGTYEFKVIQGTYTVNIADKAVFSPPERDYSNLTGDNVDQNFTGIFTEYTISGYVEDEYGTRINNSTMTLTGISSTGPMNVIYFPITNGTYEFTVIHGNYDITATGQYGYFSPLSTTVVENIDHNFTLIYSTYMISGYLEDSFGSRINRSTLSLTGVSVTGSVSLSYIPTSDGTYEFEVIQGSYTVTPTHDEGVFTPVYVSTDPLTTDLVQNFIVDLPTYTISGKVEDTIWNDVQGTTVVVTGISTTGPVSLSYISEADGSYEFKVIKGSYTIEAIDYATFSPSYRSSAAVTSDWLNQDFEGTFTEYTINGYIKDNDGHTIKGSTVTLTGDSSTGTVNMVYFPGSDGYYEFSARHGSYEVTPTDIYGTFDPVNISTASLTTNMTQDFIIDFTNYNISGYIEDTSGNRVNRSTIILTGISSTESVSLTYNPSEDGEYEFTVIHGSYTITPNHLEGTFSPISITSTSLATNMVQNFVVDIDTYMISGYIEDTLGERVHGSTLILSGISSTGTVYMKYSPISNGEYEFEVIRGSYTIEVEDYAITFDPSYRSYADVTVSTTDQNFIATIFDTFTITGYIEDGQGNRINGSTITLTGDSPIGPVNLESIPTSNGEYHFYGIKEGNYTITPAHDYATFDPVSITTVTFTDHMVENFEIIFNTYTIEGYVKDRTGNRLGGSTITLSGTSSTGAVSITYYPGSDGDYEFNYINGDYVITPTHLEGTFDPATRNYSSLHSNLTSQNFTVVIDTYVIQGKIKDSNGVGIGDTTVTINGISSTGTVSYSYLTQSDDGNYEFNNLVRGSYTITAMKLDGTFNPGFITKSDLSIDYTSEDIEVEFTTYTIEGVIEDSNGVKISGATVTLSGISPTGSVSLTYYTVANGSYTFQVIRGSYTVTPIKQDGTFSPDSFSYSYSGLGSDQTGQDFEVSFVEYSLGGTITDSNGITIARTSLTLTGISSTGSVNLNYITGNDGSYEFSLIRGSYTVVPYHLEATFNPESTTYADLGEDLATEDYEVIFDTYVISGKVKDEHGVGVKYVGLSVTGESSTGTVSMSYETTSDGLYEFELILGTYTITTTYLEGTVTPSSMTYESLGSNHSQDYEVEFTTYKLRGFVYQSGYQNMIEGSTITLSGESSTGTVNMSYITGSDGIYEFSLIRGSYTVIAEKDDASSSPPYLTYEDFKEDRLSEFYIMTFSTYTISGKIKDGNGAGINGSTVSLSGISATGSVSLSYLTGSDGIYNFEVIHGSYTVEGSMEDGSFSPVYISSADLRMDYLDQDFEVELETYTISGEIEDINGIKIEGATVTLSGISATGTVSMSYVTGLDGMYEFNLRRGSYTIVPSEDGSFSPWYISYANLGQDELTSDFIISFNTYTIRGLIKDGNESTIANTTLTLTGQSSTGPVSLKYCTSGDGEYEFEVIRGTYTIVPEHLESTFDPVSRVHDIVSDEEDQDYTVTITTYRVSGVIKDVNNVTIKDTTVTISGISSTGPVNLVYITGNDGAYEFNVIRGSYTIIPEQESASFDPIYISTADLNIDLTQDFDVEFRIYKISGLIKDENGTEIRATTLTLTGISATGTVNLSYLTSYNGIYEFTLIRGSYTVVLSKEDGTFTPSYITYPNLVNDELDEDYTVVFTTYKITGSIKDINGIGIKETTVNLRGITSTGAVNMRYITSNDGTYEFNGVIRGSYTIIPEKQDGTFTPDYISLTESDFGVDQTGKDFEVSFETYTISGELKSSEGQGIVNTTLTLTGVSSTGSVNMIYLTGSSGEYEFELIRGSYTIELHDEYGPSSPGYISYPDLGSNEINQDYTITLNTYSITGNILDGMGAGVSGATVALTGISPTGTVSLSYLTSSNGEYEFYIARGSYTINPSHIDGEFTPGSMSYQDVYTNYTTQDFEVGFTTYRISGIIKYENGAGIQGTTVTLTGISPTGTVNLTYITESDGLYEFELIRGSYTVEVVNQDLITSNPGYITYPDLGTDETDKDYTLTLASYTIKGVIEDVNGTKIINATVTLSGVCSTGTVNIIDMTDSNGEYEFRLLRGYYEVLPSKPDGAFTPTSKEYTDLDSDKLDEDYEIVFGNRYKIGGRIIDTVGTGIKNTTVTLTGISGTGTVSITEYTQGDGAYEFDLIRGSYTVVPDHLETEFEPIYKSYADLNTDNYNQDFIGSITTYTIRGIVKDENGIGICNTTLTITGISSTGTINLKSYSGSDGSYEFSVIRGSYTVVPEHIDGEFNPGYKSYADITSDETGEDYIVSITSYVISGYIEDILGNRVNGSTITLTGLSTTGPVSMKYIPSSEGEYEFNIIKGSYTIICEHDGGVFTPVSMTYVDVSNDQLFQNYELNFDNYKISGIVSSEDDVSIEGATLTLNGISSTGIVSITTITESSGTYEFTGLIKGSYTVTGVYDEGIFSPNSTTYTNLISNQENEDYEVNFPKYSIEGTIKDNSGIGIEGTTITIIGEEITGRGIARSIISASDGSYIISDLIKGIYETEAEDKAYGFSPDKISYDLVSDETGEDYTGELTTYTIRGYIKDTANIGIEGATITLTGTSVTGPVSMSYITTSNGGYEFNSLFYGDYTITPVYYEYDFNPINKSYDPLAQTEEAEDYEGIEKKYVISGYIKTIGNELVEGATVTLSGSRSETYITKVDGYYILRDLDRGDYIVEAEHKDYKFEPEIRDYQDLSTNHISQTFEAEITTYTISGYIIDQESGEAIGNATVTLRIGSSTETITVITDINGYYEFHGLGGLYHETNEIKPLYQILVEHKDYDFSPMYRNYDEVYEDKLGEDFDGIGAILEIEESILDFGELELGVVKVLAFKITNAGGGTLEGDIEADKTWVALSSSSFTGNEEIIEVEIDRDLFEADGYYRSEITVTSTGGTKKIEVLVMATCVLTKPNPYNPRLDGELKFYGSGVVANDTEINIFTISGEHVKRLEERQGLLEIPWDGKNENGDEVVNGIYIYTSKSPKERWTGKFTVIKK